MSTCLFSTAPTRRSRSRCGRRISAYSNWDAHAASTAPTTSCGYAPTSTHTTSSTPTTPPANTTSQRRNASSAAGRSWSPRNTVRTTVAGASRDSVTSIAGCTVVMHESSASRTKPKRTFAVMQAIWRRSVRFPTAWTPAVSGMRHRATAARWESRPKLGWSFRSRRSVPRKTRKR